MRRATSVEFVELPEIENYTKGWRVWTVFSSQAAGLFSWNWTWYSWILGIGTFSKESDISLKEIVRESPPGNPMSTKARDATTFRSWVLSQLPIEQWNHNAASYSFQVAKFWNNPKEGNRRNRRNSFKCLCKDANLNLWDEVYIAGNLPAPSQGNCFHPSALPPKQRKSKDCF